MLNRVRLFVLAMLLLPLIAACGTSGNTATSPTSAPAAPTEAAAVPTEAPAVTEAPVMTEAPAETATTAAGGTGTPLKIGLVTDVGKLNDKSFNESAWKGAQMGAEAIGGTSKAIETSDPNDFAKNIGQFLSEDYNVIVTVGFALGEATIEAAKANPDTLFIGVDQFQAEPLPNLVGLIFDEDKAGFLAGALAALYSKSGKIGAVLGTDLVPPVWKFGEGYRAGAKHVKPDIDVQTVYHSDVGFDKTFSDPEWGKATALSMFDKGVDVVFGAGGQTGNGALFAAHDRKDSGVVAIGVDSDQYLTVTEAQDVLISSAMKIIDQGVIDLLKQASEGTLQGGNFVGKVGLAPYHDFEDKIPAETKAKIEELRTQLEDGSLKTDVPPAKPAS